MRMTGHCLDPELLSRLVAGELCGPEAKQAEAHVGACAACKRAHDALARPFPDRRPSPSPAPEPEAPPTALPVTEPEPPPTALPMTQPEPRVPPALVVGPDLRRTLDVRELLRSRLRFVAAVS